MVFKSHFPLKEARQLLRETADAQPEAEAALAERRDHGMAETMKEFRVVSHSGQSHRWTKKMPGDKVPPDGEAGGHRGSCHRDQLQSGRVFGRSRDHWNLSHKHAASQGQHGTLARTDHKAGLSWRVGGRSTTFGDGEKNRRQRT